MPRAFLLSIDNNDQMLKDSAMVLEIVGLSYMVNSEILTSKVPSKPIRYVMGGILWVMYENALTQMRIDNKPINKYL
jgi:hypothetical protein